MRETETVGPPWEMDLVRESGRLVEVVIRATGTNALGYDELREATRQALDKVRPERRLPMPRPLGSDAIQALTAAHEAGNGPSSEEYLARLAIAYEEQAATNRDPAARIAAALGLSTQTVKQHLVKARKDGFLSRTAEGQKGGEAEEKARTLVAKFDHATDGATISTSVYRKG